jgi:hypothetical protein
MPDYPVPPMINNEAAHEAAMMADMEKRRAEEAAIAAVQDKALEDVRRQCDEERKRMGQAYA